MKPGAILEYRRPGLPQWTGERRVHAFSHMNYLTETGEAQGKLTITITKVNQDQYKIHFDE